MQYRTPDNGFILTTNGDAPELVVAHLNMRALFARSWSNEAYMVQAAKRARMQTGFNVRAGNEAEFIADLVAAGLLLVSP